VESPSLGDGKGSKRLPFFKLLSRTNPLFLPQFKLSTLRKHRKKIRTFGVESPKALMDCLSIAQLSELRSKVAVLITARIRRLRRSRNSQYLSDLTCLRQFVMAKSASRAARNNRSNLINPNNPAYHSSRSSTKAASDNRSDQLNPNNEAYSKSRCVTHETDKDDDSSTDPLELAWVHRDQRPPPPAPSPPSKGKCSK
jgi:hypothetical protein